MMTSLILQSLNMSILALGAGGKRMRRRDELLGKFKHSMNAQPVVFYDEFWMLSDAAFPLGNE